MKRVRSGGIGQPLVNLGPNADPVPRLRITPRLNIVPPPRLLVVPRESSTLDGRDKLLRDHSLRVFWIAGKKDLATWDYLVRVVNRWNDIENALATKGAGPWFMAINDHGLSEIAV